MSVHPDSTYTVRYRDTGELDDSVPESFIRREGVVSQYLVCLYDLLARMASLMIQDMTLSTIMRRNLFPEVFYGLIRRV